MASISLEPVPNSIHSPLLMERGEGVRRLEPVPNSIHPPLLMERGKGVRPHKLYLSLGTNLGDREQNLRRAIAEIEKAVGAVVRQSAFLVSEPVGFCSDNQFLNAAILVETELSPEKCLRVTQQIEREMGRTRKSRDGVHYDRIIDIDLLLYDDLRLNTPDLVIPHPRMYERDFVKIPLSEIYPKRPVP